MSDIIKEIKILKEKSHTDKIVIFTNHLKIVGTIVECTSDYFISLTDVTVLDIVDLYPCEQNDSCNELPSQCFEWLHVSAKKILAFSFIK